MSEWQPIETAPKVNDDGERARVLVCAGTTVTIATYNPCANALEDAGWVDEAVQWGDWHVDALDPQPTHRMPIPAPPSDERQHSVQPLAELEPKVKHDADPDPLDDKV